jgi:hypothetical protein
LFNSEADIANALATNALPAGLDAVAYDPEGIATPAVEQAALGNGDTSYVTQAVSLAHSHGLKLYFIPSADVGDSGTQGGFLNKYTTWLSEHRGNWAALGEDLYSIQSQQAEGTTTYASFVPAAVAQARAADPNIPIDVGIGINPHNPPTCITTQDLIDAYNVSISAGASGFWNNVESGKNCSVPDSVYVQFFDFLYTGTPTSTTTTTTTTTTPTSSTTTTTSVTTTTDPTTGPPPDTQLSQVPCAVVLPAGLEAGRCTGTFEGHSGK